MEWRYPLLGIAEHGLFKSGKRTGSINRNWVDERDNLLENYRQLKVAEAPLSER